MTHRSHDSTYSEALDVVLHGALVELVDELGLFWLVFLELLLHRIKQHPAQLLHVMLLPGWREGGEGGREGRREGGREGWMGD